MGGGAEGGTDKGGVANAEFELRTSGALTVHAAFGGNDRYAPSSGCAPVTITGDAQLYVQRAGVRIPGMNVAPQLAPVMLGASSVGTLPAIARMWPAMSGWPIALVLIVVWSLYGLVALLVARISRAEEAA